MQLSDQVPTSGVINAIISDGTVWAKVDLPVSARLHTSLQFAVDNWISAAKITGHQWR
jgi:hypothetical protein